MQYVIYDKNDGMILSVKKNGSGKVTKEAAQCMFPDRKVGVWVMGDRILSVKNNRVALTDKGEPKGLTVFDYEKEFEIENFINKTVNPSKIVYKGVFFDHGGYANMNREIVFRLSQRPDVDLRVEIIPSGKQIDNFTFEKLNYLSRKNIRKAEAVNIIGFTPMAADVSHYNVFFTMMETQSLHPDFAKACNAYADAIITPTYWNKDVFIKGGIKRPIYVAPLGVNIDIYKPGLEKLPISCRELPSGKKVDTFPSFNYITLFGWSYRKGIDVLIKAYCDQFTSKDDVGFIICSRYMGSSDIKAQRVVERDILSFMQGYADPPRVYYYGENTDITKMPNLMANGDCFLWGSRGEGYGLPVMEAGALNMPVVSTYNSAMTDYLREDNSFLVETDRCVVAPRNVACISPYYVGQLFPELGREVVKKFGERIKEVYNNYSFAKKKAEVFSSEIRKKYNWDVCAEKVLSILKQLKEKKNV